MQVCRWTLSQICRQLHTVARDGPSDTLRRRVAFLEKKKKSKNPRNNQLFVEVPEPRSYLDTATMPMILTAVGVALFAKLLMMLDDSRSQEMIERKIKNAPAGQGTVRMLTREEWEQIQEIRPRTPFESKLARPNARIRSGEPVHLLKLKLKAHTPQGVVLERYASVAKAEASQTVMHLRGKAEWVFAQSSDCHLAGRYEGLDYRHSN